MVHAGSEDRRLYVKIQLRRKDGNAGLSLPQISGNQRIVCNAAYEEGGECDERRTGDEAEAGSIFCI